MYVDHKRLSNVRQCQFQEFAFNCRKGFKENFLTINQDILIIQNSYKNVKLYAVFEGLGLNPGAFMDFVKIYLTLAIMGNSWLLRSPVLVLQQACKYVG